jgi:Domain of unknown function (DUF4271)
MKEFVLHTRNVENKEWVALVLVLCLLFVMLTKIAFENKFSDFRNLFFSDKYIKTYRDSSHLMTWFTFLLFIVQILTFSFFIHYLIYYLGYSTKADWIIYIRIVTFLAFFVLSKYLIEKIISTAFDIEEFAEQYNMIKVSYRSFIALLLLPTTAILFYNKEVLPIVVEILLYVLLASNAIIYLKGFKIFQKIIIGKLFYFILYLCTLEIAPYYFMYYWFTNK